jgi:hypothetical protein
MNGFMPQQGLRKLHVYSRMQSDVSTLAIGEEITEEDKQQYDHDIYVDRFTQVNFPGYSVQPIYWQSVHSAATYSYSYSNFIEFQTNDGSAFGVQFGVMFSFPLVLFGYIDDDTEQYHFAKIRILHKLQQGNI